jgi:hypothetical protein
MQQSASEKAGHHETLSITRQSVTTQVGRGINNSEGFTMLTSIRGLMAATLLAGSSFAAMPAMADEADAPSDVTLTGSAAIVSQYRFRGLAQSDNKPVVQAAMTVAHKSGFYLSAWGLERQRRRRSDQHRRH